MDATAATRAPGVVTAVMARGAAIDPVALRSDRRLHVVGRAPPPGAALAFGRAVEPR